MAYSNFSLSKVKADFNLTINETTDLFSQVPPVPPSDYLKLTLREHLPLVNAINTEKARSELVIMPVLIEVRRYLNYQVSLFSGSEFSVDAAKGLEGRCDFILTRSPEQYYISRPVVTIVEAKNENIKAGLGQCIATMLAAYLFNQQEGTSADMIYGAVTTGTDWKFLKLDKQMVYIDRDDYYIKEIDQILGILASTLQPEPALTGS
jgi:hypothetical protein